MLALAKLNVKVNLVFFQVHAFCFFPRQRLRATVLTHIEKLKSKLKLITQKPNKFTFSQCRSARRSQDCLMVPLLNEQRSFQDFVNFLPSNDAVKQSSRAQCIISGSER